MAGGRIESLCILALAVVVFWVQIKIIRRLRLLEGVLPICAFCKKIRSEKSWVPLEEFISGHSHADFSHTFCPACAKANYGEYFKEDQG